MSNIVKKENNSIVVVGDRYVIPKELPISGRNRELYLADKNFPKICEIQDMNLIVNPIHSYINMTILDKGVNMPPEEIDYLKQRVTQDILRDFTRLTLEEIRLSFYYGVRGEMGEFFGLNPATFYKWMKEFKYEIMPPVNIEVSKYLEKPKEPEIPKQNVTDRNIANTLIIEFKKFRDNKVYSYYDFGNIGYRLLERLGIINLSLDEKNQLLEQSEGQFRSNLIQRNQDLTLQGKSFLKADLERAFEQIEQGSNPTFQTQIRIGAMRIAVYNCLKNFVDKEIDFENEINTKLKEFNYGESK